MRGLIAALAFAVAPVAAGQCDVWLPTPGDSALVYSNPYTYTLFHLRAVDHDGPGPLPPTLYNAYPLARWNGLAWEVVPALSTSNPTVNCLEALNDSAGGLPPGRLLLGGRFDSTDGSCRVIAAWDGHTLSGIGPSTTADFSTNASVSAITTWDPDGPGPMEPWIIVGGSFTRLGGLNTPNIAAWDGTQWRALGPGVTATVNTLTSFDPDGAGPALPLLIAGGSSGMIKSWNGSAWQTMGAGFLGIASVNSLAVFDPDADGPAVAALWAAGTFSSSGATQLPGGLALWNGTAWVGPAGFTGAAQLLRVLDLDGPGPQLPKLVLGGSFGTTPAPTYQRTVAIFDGTTWTPLDGSPNGGTVSPTISSLEVFDPDSSGPRGPELLVNSSTITQIGWPSVLSSHGLGAWDGQRWMTLGSEFLGPVKWFEWLDDVGDGVTPPSLYAVGAFSAVGGTLADSVAKWDGARWVGIGTPHGHSFRQVLTHDPDGPGGQAPSILAVEASSQSPGLDRLQNGAWTPFSPSPGFSGLSAISYDDDGVGPSLPKLFAIVSTRVYRFNGAAWSSVDTPGGSMWLFRHLDMGSTRPSLYGLVGGAVKRWDGSAWASITTRYSNNNLAVARAVSWDPDGDGPRGAEVVLGSSQVGISAFAESYDGQGWRRVALAGGTARFEMVWTPATFDPDGAGPQPPQLVLGLGASTASLFARLANDQWIQPSPGVRNRDPYNSDPNSMWVQAFATVDPDGEGPLPPELWIGGNFTHANGAPAANWTRWRLASRTPVFTQQPANATACLNGAASFAVSASDATTYSWRTTTPPSGPGWAVLIDGPLLVGGQQVAVITGAATASLQVQSSGLPFTAVFRCAAGNDCASTESASAQLTVAPCCGSADFDCDSDAGTDADIEAFFACIAGNCPQPPCTSTADFNADGDTGTDADIESFFRVLAGGPC